MILVTGASGMTGTYLIRKLISEGHKVRAIIHQNEPKNLSESILKLVEWKKCNILDPSQLDEVFEGITKVYHCAAMVSFQSSDKEKMMETNIDGTANIVNYCIHHKIEKLVHMSSIAALGREQQEGVITEDSTWSDSTSNSSYAISKFLSELEVWRGAAEGLNVAIVNPGVILGTGNWEDNTARMWPIIERGVNYYPTGQNGFVDVRDVVEIMYQLMESDINSERFILCSENLFYKDLLGNIASNLNAAKPNRKLTKFKANLAWRTFAILQFFTGKKAMFTKEHTAFMLGTYQYDNSKIVEQLSWSFRTVEETIKDISKLYLEKRTEAAMLP